MTTEHPLATSPLPHGRPYRPVSATATLLGVIALAMLVLTLQFSYLYLAINDGGWPPPGVQPPPVGLPLVATVVLAAGALPALLLLRAARSGSGPGLQGAAVALVLAGGGFLALQAWAWPPLDIAPSEHAYASAVVLNIVVMAVLVAAGIVAAGLLVLRVRERLDARTAGIGASLAYYWWFLVVLWLVTAALVYGTPLVGGVG